MEKLIERKDLRASNRFTIKIDDPQRLIHLAEMLKYAADNRVIPAPVTIQITEYIELQYDPLRTSTTASPAKAIQ